MARFTCPSCGAIYDGKKCRQCLYEHFTEEIAHGNHVHEGEPLVIDAPVRKPVRRKNPFGCEKKIRKRHPMAGFIVLLVLINSVLPILRNWGLELEEREKSHMVAVPERAPWMPENAILLWEEGNIRLYGDWNPDADTLTIYAENDYRYPVRVYSREVVVNGFAMESSGIYCDAYERSTTRAAFDFYDTELQYAGIGDIQTVSFRLEVMGEGNASLFLTDTITLGLE